MRHYKCDIAFSEGQLEGFSEILKKHYMHSTVSLR